MKVLKKGRDQKGWSKIYTCTGAGNGGGGCGAELLVSIDDISHTTSLADPSRHYYFFVCPSCGVWTDVEGLPAWVERRAYAKD